MNTMRRIVRGIAVTLAVSAITVSGASIAVAAPNSQDTAYVTSNFIGGAVGSSAAAVLWSTGGWTAVTIAGIALSCFALIVWAVGRRGALVVVDMSAD